MGASGLSAATIAKRHSQLRAVFNQAMRWQLVKTNPVLNASPPKVPKHDNTVPTTDDLKRLIAASSPTFGIYVRVAALCGPRRGELVGLRWGNVVIDQDVDGHPTGGSIVLSEVVETKPGGGTRVRRELKGKHSRTVELDLGTAWCLASLFAALTNDIGSPPEGKDYVFSDDLGMTPWYPDSVSRRFRKACERVGLVDVRLHDLRHFTGTEAHELGEPLKAVQARLGHDDLRTTANIYTARRDGADRRLAQKLGERLDGPAAQPELADLAKTVGALTSAERAALRRLLDDEGASGR